MDRSDGDEPCLLGPVGQVPGAYSPTVLWRGNRPRRSGRWTAGLPSGGEMGKWEGRGVVQLAGASIARVVNSGDVARVWTECSMDRESERHQNVIEFDSM